MSAGPTMLFADLMANLVTLEERVAKVAAEQVPNDEPRVYEWRPSGVPELPAIWNWIMPGSDEIIDTARQDDIVIVRATVGVRPADLTESMGQLVRLTDVLREVVDPALADKRPLGCRQAKRISTGNSLEDFNGVPVMCMDVFIRATLTAFVRGVS